MFFQTKLVTYRVNDIIIIHQQVVGRERVGTAFPHLFQVYFKMNLKVF